MLLLKPYFKKQLSFGFFNCTNAKHAGLSYGMQVRVDTRACEAFAPYDTSPSSIPEIPEIPEIHESYVKEESNEPVVGLCSLGKRTLIAVNALAIIIVTWLLFTCASM